MSRPPCAFCGTALEHVFVDLGTSPLANSYLAPGALGAAEPSFPLRVYVCHACLLVQLPPVETPEEIFGHYAYFSSFSDSWLEHARRYVELAAQRFGLGSGSQVVEIASNDGYLLQYFAGRGVPVLGVEPAANVAEAARARGIPTVVRFFGTRTADELLAEGGAADLVVANNVLAHVPDLNDFVRGIGRLLKPGGAATLEFPHLMRLVAENQFDTIYHEHLSYFSFLAVERIFAAHGLTLFDVEELPTHGGSLRIYARHADNTALPVSPGVDDLRRRELEAGFGDVATYRGFGERVRAVKEALLGFLTAARREGKSVAAYGAPAKGNTLLNYCGIRSDYVAYTVDRSPHKQGHYLPGSRIPVEAPAKLAETRPDYVLILPWNLCDEIVAQNAFIGEWGGRFVVPIPELRVLEPVGAC